jgi:hypothetical protein
LIILTRQNIAKPTLIQTKKTINGRYGGGMKLDILIPPVVFMDKINKKKGVLLLN